MEVIVSNSSVFTVVLIALLIGAIFGSIGLVWKQERACQEHCGHLNRMIHGDRCCGQTAPTTWECQEKPNAD